MATNNALNALANPALAQGIAAPAPEEGPASPPIQLQDFLEKTPPGAPSLVLAQVTPSNTHHNRHDVKLPTIVLHCMKCDGERKFAGEGKWILSPVGTDHGFVVYRCKNCGSATKTFAIRTVRDLDDNAPLKMEKFGEMPPFGPPLSAGVSKLLGSERQYYFKGRRAENQSMGIAAFGYYRRVVDSRKNALFDRIIKVSETLGADADLIADLEAAKAETQFTKGVDHIKHALPQALLVKGYNPLTLLYGALSEHMHNKSDEECLELARHVRVVLSELVERVEAVLVEDAELGEAVKALAAAKGKGKA